MVENGKETIVNIDDEIPFDIPESWAWCRLGSIATTIHYGYTASAADNGSVRLLRITDIQNDDVNWNKVPFCDKDPDDIESYRLYKNDILIARTGGTIGKSYMISKEIEDLAVFASYLIRIVLAKEVSASFIKLYLDTSLYWQLLMSKSMGIGQPNVNGESLKSLLLPLPSLKEQKKIVKFVENLTNKISQIDGESSLIEEKISLAKSKLLDLAIRGKLLPQDENDEPASKLLERIRKEKESAQLTSKSKRKTAVSYIFKGEDNLYYEKIGNSVYLIDDELPCKLPDNWQWAQFSDICDLYTGNSISKEVKAKKYTNLNNGYNYIGTKDVGFDNQINYNNGVKIPFAEMGFKIAPKNAVLLCIEGGSAGRKIGVTREDVCFGNKLCCFYSKTICNEFIYIYLQSPLFKKLFKESLMGLIGGVGTGSLEKIYVPIPPINEQKRISNFLDKAFEQLDSLIQH